MQRSLSLSGVAADLHASGALYRSHGLLAIYWYKVEQHRVMRYLTSAVDEGAYFILASLLILPGPVLSALICQSKNADV